MKFFSLLWEFVLSLFQHPYERQPRYHGYMAYWGQKLRAEYCSNWSVVAMMLAFLSIYASVVDMMTLAVALLSVSIYILLLAMTKFEAILYKVSEGKSNPGLLVSLTVIQVIVPTVLIWGFYPAEMAQAPLLITVILAGIGVAISSPMIMFDGFGNRMFDRAWKIYTDKNPSKGYIDWDSRYVTKVPKVSWLRSVK